MTANNKQHGGNHYQVNGMQHWDFTWENKYNQFEYCISKYVLRCYKKNGEEDIRKALHHAEKYLEVQPEGDIVSTERDGESLIAFMEPYDLSADQQLALILVHTGNIKLAILFINNILRSMEDLPRTYVNPDL